MEVESSHILTYYSFWSAICFVETQLMSIWCQSGLVKWCNWDRQGQFFMNGMGEPLKYHCRVGNADHQGNTCMHTDSERPSSYGTCIYWCHLTRGVKKCETLNEVFKLCTNAISLWPKVTLHDTWLCELFLELHSFFKIHLLHLIDQNTTSTMNACYHTDIQNHLLHCTDGEHIQITVVYC